LAKNVGSFMFGEQLLTNFSTIFVIHVPNVATNEKLVKVHNKHIERQNFTMNFKVCIKGFFSFCFAKSFMKFLVWLFSFYFYYNLFFCGLFDGMYLCKLLANWLF
jgi:hypothetical protein